MVGYLLEKIFHTKYWDYSNSKFNIHGRVCLLNSIFWGILGVIFTTLLHPLVMNMLSKIPDNILPLIAVILGGYLLIDAIVSIVKVTNINIRIGKTLEIRESLKQKLEELKELTGKAGSKNTEMIKSKIEELKAKESYLIKKIYKQTLRLKKAFPSMKSETINQFLNQKIELFKNGKSDE